MAATNALLAFGGLTQRGREDIRVEPQPRDEAGRRIAAIRSSTANW